MNIRELEEALSDGADANIYMANGNDPIFNIEVASRRYTVEPRGISFLAYGGYPILVIPGGGTIEIGEVGNYGNATTIEPSAIRMGNIEASIAELAYVISEGIMVILDADDSDYVIDDIYLSVERQILDQFGDMDFEITYEYED